MKYMTAKEEDILTNQNYIPELGNLYAPEEPHYEPDNRDGEIIEEAIKGLPLELRKILKARYVSHPYASQNQLAHTLRISTKRFETDLHNAKKINAGNYSITIR